MLFKFKSLLLGALLTFHLTASAQSSNLAQAFKEFRVGSYRKALLILKKTQGNNKVLSTRFYLEGLCQNRLQNYDLALKAFKKAIRRGNTSRDINYEYGQSLYANSELEMARRAFSKSRKAGYKATHSLYYIGHISQLLEEYKKAQKAYQRLIKITKKDKSLLQIAHFQLGESLLSQTTPQDDLKKVAREKVLPQLEKAIALKPRSSLSKDIEKRMTDIERRYGLDPNLMINGKVLPKKRWKLEFSQDVVYDNNITLSTDLPSSQATQKDSFIYNSTFKGSYITNFNNLFVIAPNFRIKSTRHSDRENDNVYQNDSNSINLGLKNSFEHRLFGKQASLLFEWSHNRIDRDREAKKDIVKYARSHTFTLGEKFQYFSFGKTTFKFKYKSYRAYTDSLDNNTKTFSLDQIGVTPAGKLWVFFFQADLIDSYNNTNSSTNNYLIRVDYLYPNFYPQYTLNLAMSISLLDTKEQKATRGTEKSYTPMIKLTKAVTKKLSASTSYEYTKNTSLNKTAYEYEKQVVNFEVSYSF